MHRYTPPGFGHQIRINGSTVGRGDVVQVPPDVLASSPPGWWTPEAQGGAPVDDPAQADVDEDSSDIVDLDGTEEDEGDEGDDFVGDAQEPEPEPEAAPAKPAPVAAEAAPAKRGPGRPKKNAG